MRYPLFRWIEAEFLHQDSLRLAGQLQVGWPLVVGGHFEDHPTATLALSNAFLISSAQVMPGAIF